VAKIEFDDERGDPEVGHATQHQLSASQDRPSRVELRLRPLDSPTDEIIDFPVMPAIEVMLEAVRDDIAPGLAERIAH
jgi:hypothetical protein